MLTDIDVSEVSGGFEYFRLGFAHGGVPTDGELSELLNSKTKYENVTNPLFCRRISLVFDKWFAYLPFWTSLLTEFEGRYSKGQTPLDIRAYEQGRLTNAQVECYFGVLKESVFERKTNLRPAEVIFLLYRSVQVQLKAEKLALVKMWKTVRANWKTWM